MARPRLRGPAFALGLLALATATSCGPAGQGPTKQYVGTPVRLTVGPAGGSVTSSDGNLTVTIPAGALSATVDVVIYQYVNPAPGGQGNAYELAPAGQLFALPVTLTFKNPTLVGSTPIPTSQLWLSFLINAVAPLQGQGLWFRAGTVAVDGTANTLTAAVPDFGWTDWSVVATGPNAGKDLVGTFTLVSTVQVPFTASTTQLTLAYAGEDSRAYYYFPLGPLTLQTPVTLGAVSCNPVNPPGATVQVKTDAVVELRKAAGSVPLLLSIDAFWNLTCSDGSTALADTRFDTLGISLGGCTRGYVGTPTLTTSQIRCDAGNGCYYRIDCGTGGTETATFNLGQCTPGVTCTSPTGPCHTAAISCATGFPVCADTGTLPNGTSCGSNLVCGNGVCNACTQGATCTSANPCAATATVECGSGFPVCTDRTFLAAGTSCGSGQVCSAAGVCTTCTQGATCTSTNQCAATATVECSSGAPVCTDRTFLAAGTSCGTNMVCSAAGVCTTCTQGATCTSTNPCDATATIECSSGAPVCTDRTFLAAGTSCGTNMVCSAAGVCTSCTQGAACTSTNQCAATATVECSSGAPVCTARTFLAAGTGCGTNMVCSSAGVCTSCTQGAACTSTDPCAATATVECSSGAPVCTARTFLAAGTSCGTNMVCSAVGVCTSCTQGTACTSTNPCDATATIECSSGAPVCTDRTFLAAGTSCGTNMVCSAAGVCTSCTQGTACTSANQCAATATIECSSGAPVCTDRTFLAPGTSCGTGQVCSTSGACTTCTQGTACTSANQCAATATVECSTGGICTDRTFQAPGTSCGTNMVCSAAGACISCTQGAACASTNPCAATATVECSSGAPACTDRTFLADGTSCGGTGFTCNAGACVQSRTVTGTRMVTYWPDTGPTVPVPAPELATVPPPAPVQVAALVRDGKGGWITYLGTFPAPGSFSIPSVPVGPYLLAYVDGGGGYTFVDTSADAVDLGYDEAGRAGLVAASASTPVTFSVSGLTPWTTGGDQLQITCSDADVWDLLATTVAAAATSGTAADDWLTGNGAPAPLPLLSSDTLFVHQLATATDVTSGQAFQYASNWSSLAAVTLTSGTPATLSPALAAASQTGSLPAETWSLSQFDLLASMNPAATTDASAHSLLVGASRFPLASPGPAPRGSPLLLAMRLPRGTTPDPTVGSLAYGQFLGTGWNEWRGVDFTVHVSYTAPLATSAVAQAASVGRREAMLPPAGAIAPTLTPVQSPLVAGQNAFSSLTAVGPTPTLSWTAPATGVPTRYVVELFRLDNLVGASAAKEIAVWVTNDLSVSLPSGVLAAGSVYFARITADLAAGDPLGAATPAPLRLPATYAYASALTGTFAP